MCLCWQKKQAAGPCRVHSDPVVAQPRPLEPVCCRHYRCCADASTHPRAVTIRCRGSDGRKSPREHGQNRDGPLDERQSGCQGIVDSLNIWSGVILDKANRTRMDGAGGNPASRKIKCDGGALCFPLGDVRSDNDCGQRQRCLSLFAGPEMSSSTDLDDNQPCLT